MLFITNRELKESIKTKVNRKVNFDLDKNSPGNSVYFCRREKKEDYTEIGSKAFLTELKESKVEQLLFYIHGFSNLPEPDIFPRVQTLQSMFNAKKRNLVTVIPIIWPCDNDLGIVKDYWDDQKSADQSSFSFARVLGKFMQWRDQSPDEDQCIKRINVLAHSMGNRVLRETMRVWNKYDLPGGVPLLFRNTFLVAADIVNESLESGNDGELICHASRNVSVYFSSDDLALRASKVSNLKNKVASRRLGHTGPENMKKVPTNVYAIDCDDFNNKYDFPKGHSYFLKDDKGKAGKVFEHIYHAVTTGRVKADDQENRRHRL